MSELRKPILCEHCFEEIDEEPKEDGSFWCRRCEQRSSAPKSRQPKVIVATNGDVYREKGFRGTWSVILQHWTPDGQKAETVLTGSAPNTTYQQMQLKALTEAFRVITAPSKVVLLLADQDLAAVMKYKLHLWAKSGWTRSGGHVREFMELWDLVKPHRVEAKWVGCHPSPLAERSKDLLEEELKR